MLCTLTGIAAAYSRSEHGSWAVVANVHGSCACAFDQTVYVDILRRVLGKKAPQNVFPFQGH